MVSPQWLLARLQPWRFRPDTDCRNSMCYGKVLRRNWPIASVVTLVNFPYELGLSTKYDLLSVNPRDDSEVSGRLLWEAKHQHVPAA